MITLCFTLLILRYFLGKKLFEKSKLNSLSVKSMSAVLNLKYRIPFVSLFGTKPAA